MKLNKIIGVTAALLIGVGTVATSHADGEKAKRDQRSGRSDQGADRHRDHRKQVVLSKDEVTKRYDKTGDGTLDYREKMVFIRSLGEDERAAYRKEFSQVGQGRSDRAGGEREHGDNKRQVSRRGMQGGPPGIRGCGSHGSWHERCEWAEPRAADVVHKVALRRGCGR